MCAYEEISGVKLSGIWVFCFFVSRGKSLGVFEAGGSSFLLAKRNVIISFFWVGAFSKKVLDVGLCTFL
ncbi:MAG: hypothetical protein ACKESB_01160 [Candidatus Hodgkinia cicadicola]